MFMEPLGLSVFCTSALGIRQKSPTEPDRSQDSQELTAPCLPLVYYARLLVSGNISAIKLLFFLIPAW